MHTVLFMGIELTYVGAVVSGGALNTPQILMLSGIGPKEELRKHGIHVVQDLPMVGQNLEDHCFSPIGISLEQNEKTIGGNQSPSPMGWFKLPSVLSSAEYEGISPRMKKFLDKPTVPIFEISTVRDRNEFSLIKLSKVQIAYTSILFVIRPSS